MEVFFLVLSLAVISCKAMVVVEKNTFVKKLIIRLRIKTGLDLDDREEKELTTILHGYSFDSLLELGEFLDSCE